MGGYCFLDNAAIAAAAFRARGCDRVAILDVDFHHGNGTQSIFYRRDDVLFVSIHGDPRTEFPFYLGHADALVVSLGLDTYAGDPISAFKLQSSDFLRLGRRMARLGLPTVLVLEGGYAVKSRFVAGVPPCVHRSFGRSPALHLPRAQSPARRSPFRVRRSR